MVVSCTFKNPSSDQSAGVVVLKWCFERSDSWWKINTVWNAHLKNLNYFHTSQKSLCTRGINPPKQPKKGIHVADATCCYHPFYRWRGTSLAAASAGTRGRSLEASFVWEHKCQLKWNVVHTGENMVLEQTGEDVKSLKAFVFLFCRRWKDVPITNWDLQAKIHRLY